MHRAVALLLATLSLPTQAQPGLLERLGERLGLWTLISPLSEAGLDLQGLVVGVDGILQTQPLADLLLPDQVDLDGVALSNLLSMDEPASTATATAPEFANQSPEGTGDQPALAGLSPMTADYPGARVQGRRACLDEDGDGVCDGEDQCAYTPPNTAVLANGCVLSGASPLLEAAVFFEVNSSRLQERDLPLLDRVAGLILASPSRKLEIAGYADASGGGSLNLALSEARTDAVVRHFIRRGVPPQRLYARGYGATEVAASQAEMAGQRRVELRLITE